MKVGIIKQFFWIQLFFLSVVLANTKTVLEFEGTGTKLVNSLRVLGTRSQNSTTAEEKISEIEKQIEEIKNMYSSHSFILKGLNGLLNNKVNTLTKELQMEIANNNTFEAETGKVAKGLNHAISISPFRYINKFKTISTKKLERIMKKYDLTAKKGEELTEEQKKKKRYFHE
ncbi:Irc18p [Saccharomyces cerevisiae x Saccharomyces kudriavzevii VIN7]|uniref:Irc18p n=1 Tax=Saccharomyces cerevisiae x Saccharomyces kudriavzevii (strain VIN7) TaxID=1095631 RepID=H0GWU8_SACCK|nr:Irc18p [Saccharomyces cerevisiae x Saccharomyces kudriavzevii VIN7]